MVFVWIILGVFLLIGCSAPEPVSSVETETVTAPTAGPTNTVVPTVAPTNTVVPTVAPSNTVAPTIAPSNTVAPTVAPSNTAIPTVAPTNTTEPANIPSPLTPGPTIAAPTPVAGVLQVQMEAYGFIPEPAVVRVGSTITWINGDTWLHSATSFDGVFDTGLLSQNESYSFTFTQPGEFAYYCMRHPSVMGLVVVEP